MPGVHGGDHGPTPYPRAPVGEDEAPAAAAVPDEGGGSAAAAGPARAAGPGGRRSTRPTASTDRAVAEQPSPGSTAPAR